MDNAEEIRRLRELEFGERFEPYTRLIAVSTAGVLIYFYTGWIIALIWPLHFLAAFGLHAYFLQSRGPVVSHPEMVFAAVLFANLQAAYSWLPTIMFTHSDRALILVGAALLGAQLVFLLRRSDTLPIYAITQILITIGVSIVCYVAYFPAFNGPLAYIGAALALIGLNFYFYNSLYVARSLRLKSEESSRRSTQSQKMAAIGQLAGGVAHDFNNNLTAIIGSLELIQATDDPQEHKQDVEIALIAARQAAKTVKQLLIYARMERQNVTEVPLCTLLDELRSLTERLIPTSVALQITTPDPPPIVRADRHQLLAALINLIVNSVDAMPDGGVLTLCTRNYDNRAPKPLADGARLIPGQYVLITIADTGHGIPPDLLSKVTDPFFTTKDVGKGTGLGLSMVLGMSRELGGGLQISSGAKGTRVDIYLPEA